MSTLIILDGNIASGKSTLTQQLAARFPNVRVFSDDAIITMIGAGDYSRGFQGVDMNVIIGALGQFAGHYLSLGRDVVIDMPLHTKARRGLLLASIGAAMESVTPVAVTTGWDDPFAHALRRIKSDDRGYVPDMWLKVARDLDDEREAIGPEEVWYSYDAPEFLSLIENVSDLSSISFTKRIGGG